VHNAEDNLRRLLAIPADDPIWDNPIAPVDRPTFEDRAVDLDAALATAMEHRSELATAEQVLRNNELNERVAKNFTKHSLKFAADYGPTWSTSDQTLPPPSTTEDDDSRTGRSR
jgi:hypothetical protein